MKYPRHEHVRRSILLQEPRRDCDLTDEDLVELQSRKEQLTPEEAAQQIVKQFGNRLRVLSY